MVDTGITAHSIGNGWATFGRRVAVASGALAALVSLLVDAPVWVASARGAATTLAVLLIVRAASQVLERQEQGAEAEVQNDAGA